MGNFCHMKVISIEIFIFFQLDWDMFSDIYYPQIVLKPKTTNSLPNRYRPSRSRSRRTPLSMYSSPQFIHRTTPFLDQDNFNLKSIPSQSSLNSCTYQNLQNYASSFQSNFDNNASVFNTNNDFMTDVTFVNNNMQNHPNLNFSASDKYNIPIIYKDNITNYKKYDEPIYYECASPEKYDFFTPKYDLRYCIIEEENLGEI